MEKTNRLFPINFDDTKFQDDEEENDGETFHLRVFTLPLSFYFEKKKKSSSFTSLPSLTTYHDDVIRRHACMPV